MISGSASFRAGGPSKLRLGGVFLQSATGALPFRERLLATFVDWRAPYLSATLRSDRLRLEDVASGYWTLSIKQSSGLVSHYGSSPSSSADLSTRVLSPAIVGLSLIDSVPIGIARPRLTTGAFVFLEPSFS